MLKLLVPKNKFTWLLVILLVYIFVIYEDEYSPNTVKNVTALPIKAAHESSKFLEAPSKALLEKMQETPRGKAIVDAIVSSAIEEEYGSTNLSDVAAKTTNDVLTFDTKKGTGEIALCGSHVKLDADFYMESRIKFDTTRNKTPLEFMLGGNTVLPGLERGVVGMKVGGKRKMIIPASLAYGHPDFKSNFISKDKPITVEATLVSIQDPVKDVTSSVQTTELVEGLGDQAICGQKVKISYKLGYQENGQIHLTQPEIIHFTIGKGQVPIGLEQGVLNMRTGGTRGMVLQPDLQRSLAPSTPPLIAKSVEFPIEPMITFEVKLLAVE